MAAFSAESKSASVASGLPAMTPQPLKVIIGENSTMLSDQVILTGTICCESLTAYPTEDGFALLADHFVAPVEFLDHAMAAWTPFPAFRVFGSPVVDNGVLVDILAAFATSHRAGSTAVGRLAAHCARARAASWTDEDAGLVIAAVQRKSTV